MTDKSMVSVIVPTKNSEATIGKCLESIRNQSYPSIEIIVVDSCSKDKTRKIAENYKAKIIRVHSKRSEARNIGAEKAEGEVIFFVDSDMELGWTVVEECVKKIRNGYDAVVVPEISIGAGFWSRCRALEKSCYIGDEAIEAARFFDKRVFEAVNGYDVELEAGEDWDLNSKIRKKGFSIQRVRGLIKHNEGKLGLWETVKKKYGYGKALGKYKEKHPRDSGQQLKLLRPALIRHWRKLVKNPRSGAGLIILKACEFGAAGIGYMTSKFSFQESPERSGRLNTIERLKSKGKFSLCVGAKETRLSDINIDIDPSTSPNIVADARFLPFQGSIFQQLLFTDVIEHLQKSDQSKALQEIHRVLCETGELILTTPRNCILYTLLDPAKYVMIHRHYKEKSIQGLLESHGFEIEKMFTAGELWACLNNLWYCFIAFPLKKIHQESSLP